MLYKHPNDQMVGFFLWGKTVAGMVRSGKKENPSYQGDRKNCKKYSGNKGAGESKSLNFRGKRQY